MRPLGLESCTLPLSHCAPKNKYIEKCYVNSCVYIESFHASHLYIVSIEIFKNLYLWRELLC